MVTALQPRHQSTLKRQGVLKPNGLTRMVLPDETRIFLEAECLDIFTRMVNAQRPMQEILVSIYLSGMSAATEAGQ